MPYKPPDKPIDKDFINKWKDHYNEDDIGGDEAQYIDICKKVSKELLQGTITKDTFIEILDWKSHRIKGKVRWKDFDNYEVGIKEAYKALVDDQKLSILDDLYGIGVPAASTILHFMYPSNFPIMDIRVADTLLEFEYLTTTTSVRYYVSCAKNYAPYCVAIRDIARGSKHTLRDVDKAIFAYHKIMLRPKGSKCKRT